MTIQQLLELTIIRQASDLHLIAGEPPVIRLHGELMSVAGVNPLTNEDVERLVFPLLSAQQKETILKEWELDFGLDFEDKARFRVNLYKQKETMAAAFRLIPRQIRPLDEIGLPQSIAKITELRQGLVLVTGPTGHGKSTTLASFINQINMSRNVHILTIEDPIEFIYPQGKALISQRELGSDTKSWDNSLRAALREDPDVVLVGEMRDYATMAAAITIAETGHLVFATLHTNSAAQTVDRIIDVFPNTQQAQIRVQLAAVIEGIISQRLVPTIQPGRTLAFEILFSNPALRSVIRDGKTHMIDNLIQTSGESGMVSLENSLVSLVKEGKISAETALNYSVKPEVISKLLGLSSGGGEQ